MADGAKCVLKTNGIDKFFEAYSHIGIEIPFKRSVANIAFFCQHIA